MSTAPLVERHERHATVVFTVLVDLPLLLVAEVIEEGSVDGRRLLANGATQATDRRQAEDRVTLTHSLRQVTKGCGKPPAACQGNMIFQKGYVPLPG